MEKIELVNPITVEGKEIKEFELDFSKITGAAMFIAAKASGISYKQLCDLPGGDFQKILLAVNRFLFQ